MSDSTTLIQQIVAGANADVRINENFDAASPAMVFGRRAATTTGLTWGFYGGRWSGIAVASGTVTLGASTTTYLSILRSTGVVSASTATTNWNNTELYARAYKIVTGASTVTSYEDHRAGAFGTYTGYITASEIANTPAGTISATNVQAALNELDTEKEALSNKDASGGYAGLTLFKLNLRNAANTITSWLTTAATAARTWTLPDYDGTLATLAGTESLSNKTLVAPILGTPTSGTLTNCTGLPAAGVTGTALVAAAIGTTVQAYDADLTTWAGVTPGTGVATALAVAVGSAGAPVVNGGALGTPSSGTVTNLTGTASININGTVGATTPAAGNFTMLSATGQISGTVSQDVTATTYATVAKLTSFDSVGGYQYLQGAGLLFNTTQLNLGTLDTAGIYGMRTETSSTEGYLSLQTASGGVLSQRATISSTGLAVTGGISATGNTTLGDASTDAVTVNGYMGVGGASTGNIGLAVLNAALTGAGPIGLAGIPTGPATATSSIRAVYGRADTAAATFTVSDVMQFSAANSTKGAGSTITNQHGFYIVDQTQGTNNYGITSLVSSGTNKWNIYASGTAQNYFAGNVGIGTSTTFAKFVVSDNGSVGMEFTPEPSGNTINSYRRSGGSAFVDLNQQALNFVVGTGATPVERLRVNSIGNFGIGTNAPANLGTNVTTVTVSGPAGGGIQFQRTDATAVTAVAFVSTGGFFLGTITNSQVAIRTNNTERIRIDDAGNVTTSTALAATGYGTGAGGTVTQATSKATAVTLSKATGKITLNAAALAANTTVSFTLTNTVIAATDILTIQHVSDGTIGAYTVTAFPAAGSATVALRNVTAGSLSEAVVLRFAIVRSVDA